MKQNLLIVGAGLYGVVAKEIAKDMNCFDRIDFIDDNTSVAFDGTNVIGTFSDLIDHEETHGKIIVAIGNSDVRLAMLRTIRERFSFEIVSLISPHAYVSPSAEIMAGCIIEPMAVIHAKCVINIGCLVSAGAVVNHAGVCEKGVHVDCHATVEGYTKVPSKTKIESGSVFRNMNK